MHYDQGPGALCSVCAEIEFHKLFTFDKRQVRHQVNYSRFGTPEAVINCSHCAFHTYLARHLDGPYGVAGLRKRCGRKRSYPTDWQIILRARRSDDIDI